MGRSVEVRRGALVTAYADWSGDYDSYIENWEPYDEDDEPPTEDDYYEYIAPEEWQSNVEWLQEQAPELWPSLRATDRWAPWPDRETRVVLENQLIEISVSEYCGLTAICVAPREGVEYDGLEGLSLQFATRMRDKFLEAFSNYYRVGGFSDGTSVYTKAGIND